MYPFPSSATPGPGWRKSSYSGQDGNCVEACNGAGLVLVRDTRYREGPVLQVTAAAWRQFATSLKAS